MQANKGHLMQIAELLGLALPMSMTTERMLDAIRDELVTLHVCIVRLIPGVPRGGKDACSRRMVALRLLAGVGRAYRPPPRKEKKQ